MSRNKKYKMMPISSNFTEKSGYLFRENLKIAEKDEHWVRQILGEYRSSIAGTWLLSVDRGGNVIWQGKEKPL